MKKEISFVKLELIEDSAPEQFAEASDPMMIYRIKINNELMCGTDEGTSLKEMVKISKEASKFFAQVAKKLEKKKQIGKRCT